MSVYIARDKSGNPKSPFWQYDFQCLGRRFSGSFDGQQGRPEIRHERPRKDAQRAETVVRSVVAEVRQKRPRLTLHQAGAHYWTQAAQHQANADSEWCHIANLERLIGKNLYIDEIDDAVCSKFVATRRAETARRRKNTVSNATVNRDIEALGRILKCVRKIARMPDDIPDFRVLKLPETRRIRALSFDEDQALFAAIDELRPDFRDMLEFALLTGKRLSEIIFLDKSKIDRRGMTARVIAKGAREVVIALTATSLAIIERNWMNHASRLFTYIAQASFTGKNGVVRRKGHRYPFTKDGWREEWKAIREKAGVTDFRFHDFRHTTATRVLAATGNLKAVQDTLDHRDIGSSSRYAHTFTDERRRALEAAEMLRTSLASKAK